MIKIQTYPTIAPMWKLIVYDENGNNKQEGYCVDRLHLIGTAYSYNRVRPDQTYVVKADLPKEYDNLIEFKTIN